MLKLLQGLERTPQGEGGGRGEGAASYARTHVEGKEVPGRSTKASVVPSVAVVILHVQGREGRMSKGGKQKGVAFAGAGTHRRGGTQCSSCDKFLCGILHLEQVQRTGPLSKFYVHEEIYSALFNLMPASPKTRGQTNATTTATAKKTATKRCTVLTL